jgi:hypothetical protein
MLKTVSSITNAIGALNYKGTWNATTNTPTITSSVGVKGDYYQVSVAGSTAINGISNWGVGDVIAFNGTTWQRIEGGADLNGVNLSVSGTTTLSGLTASTALALNAGKDVVSVTNTGTGNNVLADGPTLTTPTLGAATATSVNKVAITAPANGSTLTIADGKTLTANNSIALTGTDATTMTFPSTSATIARTDAGQTFTGTQVMTSPRVLTSINDTNGNELFGVTATASAVNELTVANAATGTPPTISATGSDTNISIRLAPKGTGAVTANNSLRVTEPNGSSLELAHKTTSVGTAATTIGPFASDFGQLVIVTGIDGGAIFTDLLFNATTAGPTVLSAKSISGGPAGRTYTQSGSAELQLAMASGTYDIRCSVMYGLR